MAQHARVALLLEIARTIAPEGTRFMAGGHPLDLAEIEVCCGGSDPDMAYYCCLAPGHKGQCYSQTKGVRFTPRPAVYVDPMDLPAGKCDRCGSNMYHVRPGKSQCPNCD